MSKTLAASLLATVAASVAPSALAARPAPAFHRAGTIAAPDGGWDYASWDAAGHRLLVSHGKDVLVIDPAAPAKIRAIGEIARAHASLAIPGTDTILVTSAHDASARILDAATGRELKRIAVTGDPDATLLSPDGRTAYVMGGDSGAISVLDLVNGVETARIPLADGLEAAVLFGDHMIAVNNEDTSEIYFADLKAGKTAGKIVLTGCEHPSGMALDPQSGLALSVCANGKAALVDLAARKVVQLVPIGMGPDFAVWQASAHRFLVPCGKSGTLSVIDLADGKAVPEADVTTEASARTAALDPATGTLYLPAARFEAPKPGEKHGTMVPGSFHIVVMAPGPGPGSDPA